METGAAENNLFPHTFQSHNIKFYKGKKEKIKREANPSKVAFLKLENFYLPYRILILMTVSSF